MLCHEVIKADRRSNLYKDLNELFEPLAVLQRQFLVQPHLEFSPFGFTEQTAVSAFVWAAGKRDRLALAEYQVLKSKKPGKKPKKNGRADLWIDFPNRNYSFEFKVVSYRATPLRLRQRFNAAKRDALCVDPIEHDETVAVLIAYLEHPERIAYYQSFARESDVELALRLGDGTAKSCFIYFGRP